MMLLSMLNLPANIYAKNLTDEVENLVENEATDEVVDEAISDSVGTTQSEFDNKLNELRGQYPNYSVWNDWFDGGHQCFGFARLIGYNVFGTKPSTWGKGYNINEVKSGDLIQYGNTSGSGHTVFVTNVSGDTITFVDCNGNGNYSGGNKVRSNGVKWDNTIKKSAKIWNKYSFSYILVSPGISPDPDPDQSNHDPYGCLDSCTGGAGVINISGWAKDNDALDQAVELHVYIGGPVGSAEAEGHSGIYANVYRDDVGSHGFSTTIRTNKTGNQNVYIYAINIGGGTNPLIATGTATITPAVSAHDPTGCLDSCTGGAGVVNIRGWAKDEDAPDTAIGVHVYIGGPAGTAGVSPVGIQANQYRSDVGNHSFSETIKTDRTGTQDVYVYAINVGGGNNALIGKGTVTITPAASGHDPIGCLDVCTGGMGSVTVGGWAKDEDAPDTAIGVHVYIGGPAGTAGVSPVGIQAGGYRSDVGKHAFSEMIRTDKTGTQDVYVYAINVGGGNNALIGRGTVTITPGAPVPQGSQTISDGEYHIISVLDTSKALDVYGSSKDNEANIQLYSNLSDGHQTFYVTYLGNGAYKIINSNSGKCLDVAAAGMTAGTNVQQYDYVGADQQQWIIQSGDDGWFTIVSKKNGLYLDVEGGNSANNTNVRMWDGNGSNAQKWQFVAWGSKDGQTISDGEYHIVSALDESQGLDVEGCSTNDRANIQLYSNTKDGRETFHVSYLGDGYYKIINTYSGKSLDVAGGYTRRGTNLQQYTYGGARQQQWILRKTSDGYFKIISKGNGLCVDVQNGSAVNNANVWMWLKSETTSQKWKFIPVREPKISLSSNNGVLDASISNTKFVTEYGFVYGNQSDITLETPGRTRVAYSNLDSNGSYSLDATELTDCMIRAYAAYTDEDGATRVIYSDSIKR